MRMVVTLFFAIAMSGCVANAKMADKRDPIFRLHDVHIIERDLTIPAG